MLCLQVSSKQAQCLDITHLVKEAYLKFQFNICLFLHPNNMLCLQVLLKQAKSCLNITHYIKEAYSQVLAQLIV